MSNLLHELFRKRPKGAGKKAKFIRETTDSKLWKAMINDILKRYDTSKDKLPRGIFSISHLLRNYIL